MANYRIVPEYPEHAATEERYGAFRKATMAHVSRDIDQEIPGSDVLATAL